jgi:hypothetical protein
VLDLDPIPLADAPGEPQPEARPFARAAPGPEWERPESWRTRPTGRAFGSILSIVLCLLHGLAIWWGLGGRAGLRNGWPLWRDDHPLYYHSALVTREFLKASGTTAGYDPSFMAGYAKSVVFPASSTLPELVVALFGGRNPALAYKLYVLIAAATVPWLIGAAGWAWRLHPVGVACAIALQLLYVWTDFPINYVAFGMVPYFLSIPLALFSCGVLARFLARGGLMRWLFSACLASLAFLVHLTSALVIAPAALAAYIWTSLCGRPEFLAAAGAGLPWKLERARQHHRRLGVSGHIAFWLIPAVVLAVNVFWWLPGVWLASTKGASAFAFAHPEGVLTRLLQILRFEAPIQSVLLALGLPGLALLMRRYPLQGWTLLGFAAAGFSWGYLAGGARALDFLQPGRHTYAFYTALALTGGLALQEFRERLLSAPPRADHFRHWVLAGVILLGIRVLGFPCGGINLFESLRTRLFAREPFLSSRPSPRLLWVIDRVKRHLRPGERLLYEESGFDLPGVPDPYERGRFSGLLPQRTGVELIGGPYLHASLQSNFTQFGEGRLFGKSDWGRDHFVRYAALYRPAAILCFSPHARRFCRENPDLVRILDDDGTLLFGRIEGFEGDFIAGTGTVQATPHGIRIHDWSPGLDGSLVLRYHSVPGLLTRPEVACEPEYKEEDPVPFIRLRPPAVTRDIEVELRVPGWR